MLQSMGSQKPIHDWVTELKWAILKSGEVEFEPKIVAREKKDHCIVIKGSTGQECVKLINKYSTLVHLNILCKY